MQDIREIDRKELEAFIVSTGEKAFRAKQVHEWLRKKGVRTYSAMANIPATLRAKLEDTYSFHTADKEFQSESSDGTCKIAFKLNDKDIIEGVYIPSLERTTACISTQVGCPLGCTFCATGQMRYRRNLTSGEIFDQFTQLNELSEMLTKSRLSNLVIMGMGEPLLNYEHTMRAIEWITDPSGMDYSPSRITLSTSGLNNEIRQLADANIKFNLAISLHSADDKIRNHLMPVNKSNPLSELSAAVKYFHDKTGARVTFEYLLLCNLNDSIEDAKKLAIYCKSFPCKINLIEYNTVEGLPFKPSTPERTKAFVEFLESRNMVVNLRRSRGKDIDAACGQLANKRQQKDISLETQD